MAEKLTEIQLRDELEKLETDKQRILLDLSKVQQELRIKDLINAKLSSENKEYIDLNFKKENDLQSCNQKICLMEKETENLNKKNSDLNFQITNILSKIINLSRSSEKDKNKLVSLSEYNLSLKNIIKKLQKQMEFERIESLNLQFKCNTTISEIENLNKVNEKLLNENKRFKETILESESNSIKENNFLSNLNKENSELRMKIESYTEKISLLENQLSMSQEQNITLKKHTQLLSNKTGSLEHDLITNSSQLKQFEKKLIEVNNKYEVVNQQRSSLEMKIFELNENESKICFDLNEIVDKFLPNLITDKNINNNQIFEKINLVKKFVDETRTENIDLLYQNENLLITTEKLTNQLQQFKVKSSQEINQMKVNSNNNCNISTIKKINRQITANAN